MKQLSELQFPDNCRYSEDHIWARPEEEHIIIGISDYAQDQLGEIVYVEVPDIGAMFEKSESFGVAESVKSVSDLQIPVGGEIIEVNSKLDDSPGLVNSSPYGDGWIIVISPANPGEIDELMSSEEYAAMLKGNK